MSETTDRDRSDVVDTLADYLTDFDTVMNVKAEARGLADVLLAGPIAGIMARAKAEVLREAAGALETSLPPESIAAQAAINKTLFNLWRVLHVESGATGQRCLHVSPTPWGPSQCALSEGHEERHAYDPAEETR